MGGDQTQVHLITPGGVEDWPPMSKDRDAARLLARAARGAAVGSLGRGMNEGGRGVSITLRVLRLPHGEGLPLPTYPLRAWPPASMWWLACRGTRAGRHCAQGGPRARFLRGFAIELRPGFEAQLRPRSGLALKSGGRS
jgi:hypothetical protein